MAAALSLCLLSEEARSQLPPGCQSGLIQESWALANHYDQRSAYYCDGAFAKPNSGEVELVSFTLGPIVFGETQGALLLSQESAGAETVYVEGLEKKAGGSYRLDGTIPPAGLTIDLSAAIKPKNIRQDDLGLFAWLSRPAGKLFLPVSAGASPQARSQAVLTFRTGGALIEVKYQSCRHGGTCGDEQVVASDVPEYSLITISLPRTGQAQELDLKLTTLSPGNQKGGRMYSLMVPQ
ncbi:hypothetical protein VPG91_22640 [Nitrospirillum amazonense]|uniref:hypothetical protein n=1 Tax=Nitrospirillum amazonense TaxID=28077 RepID=UPI002DD42627|nr:hypothetical protein [Nitrospirillum amazonense]MEC4593816.1 hypothetical protein [Nitrospirillum amazonense]